MQKQKQKLKRSTLRGKTQPNYHSLKNKTKISFPLTPWGPNSLCRSVPPPLHSVQVTGKAREKEHGGKANKCPGGQGLQSTLCCRRAWPDSLQARRKVSSIRITSQDLTPLSRSRIQSLHPGHSLVKMHT